jgi:hypothetical protein
MSSRYPDLFSTLEVNSSQRRKQHGLEDRRSAEPSTARSIQMLTPQYITVGTLVEHVNMPWPQSSDGDRAPGNYILHPVDGNWVVPPPAGLTFECNRPEPPVGLKIPQPPVVNLLAPPILERKERHQCLMGSRRLQRWSVSPHLVVGR